MTKQNDRWLEVEPFADGTKLISVVINGVNFVLTHYESRVLVDEINNCLAVEKGDRR